ncbi:MAG: hypothetical protein ACHQFZ_07910 [Acidimicrobiales bacterium]
MKRRALINVGVPVLSIALLIGLWEAIVVVFNVAPYIAPRPLAALRAVTSNWSTLSPLVEGTIRETIYGFFSGALLGVGLGVVMAKVGFLQRLLYPVIVPPRPCRSSPWPCRWCSSWDSRSRRSSWWWPGSSSSRWR